MPEQFATRTLELEPSKPSQAARSEPVAVARPLITAASAAVSSGADGAGAGQAASTALAVKRGRDKSSAESVKARTEKKRKSGQSASFLGGAWKSETEMAFRDNFDS
jgi:hypothetical protein